MAVVGGACSRTGDDDYGWKSPREIKSLIDKHIDGFNSQNIELFFSVFGDTAIIIDGIAPYRWLNRMPRPSGLPT